MPNGSCLCFRDMAYMGENGSKKKEKIVLVFLGGKYYLKNLVGKNALMYLDDINKDMYIKTTGQSDVVFFYFVTCFCSWKCYINL